MKPYPSPAISQKYLISALTVRYLTGKFIYDYATGEDFIYPHQTNLNNGNVHINIVDTSQNVSKIHPCLSEQMIGI